MNLYTVIFEFLEGTYVSQHLCLDEQEALYLALKEHILDIELIDFKENLIDDIDFWIKEIGIVKLNNTNNLWYFSFSYDNKSNHCHIINTIK